MEVIAAINKDTFEKVRKYAMAAEKMERFEHSVRVAETARRMCVLYGEDPEKGYFAGVAHDMCKDLDDETQISLASRDGRPITDVERKKPALLHGRAAAVKLNRDFGVTDADIIQAVSYHTFGGENLCPLAKIIFAADKIEPGRPQSTPEYLEAKLSKSLDELVLEVVQENIDYLNLKGKVVAPQTLSFRKSLQDALAKQGVV